MALKLALYFLHRGTLFHHLPHELFLLRCPLLRLALGFPVFDFLHEEGEVSVFLEVARQYLIILCQKLLIVLLRDQVALLLHELHVPHVKLRVRLDLLDDADQILTGFLQFSKWFHQYYSASS